MDLTPEQKRAEQVLYDLWYSVAETIFEKVCEVTELDEEQKEALRSVALRPNDFHISIYDVQRDP
jgi:hypothetical protein